MQGKQRCYFTCANTAKGFVNHFASNLEGLERLYILKGGPGTGKSTLMKKIGQGFVERGYDADSIYCSSDYRSLDGLLLPSLGVGIVDGTAPHVIEPEAPGAVEEYVSLGQSWDSDKLRQHKAKILEIKARISALYQEVYDAYAQAFAYHKQREDIYLRYFSPEKADAMAKTLAAKILGNCTGEQEGRVRHRFMAAATPDGPVHFIENLTEDVPKRYLIKGRPGTGKSTLLTKIAKQAETRGLDVEAYHCSLDPDSLDMVILRELGVCLFDSTAPHEVMPSRPQDEVVDMYAMLSKGSTDVKHEVGLATLTAQSAAMVEQGAAVLGEIKRLHDDLEAIYIAAVDFSVIDGITAQLMEEIDRLAAEKTK